MTETSINGWGVLKRNRVAMISLVYLVLLLLLAIMGPMLMPEAVRGTSDVTFARPGQVVEERDVVHWLGTDVNGQDLLYRMLTGARVSLGVGLIGALLSLVLGTSYGLISGYAGGWVDHWMMRALEVIQAVPRILFIMIMIASLGPWMEQGLAVLKIAAQERNWGWLEGWATFAQPYARILVMIVALGLIEWLTMARIVRGQVLVLREMTFITAARAMGQKGSVILWKHLLPSLSTVILTYLTLTIPAVILDESLLSFLGLGIDTPAASWGSLLKDGAQVINPLEAKWWLLVFPAAMMSMTLLALNFLGDGLRDAFDPRGGGPH